MIAAVAGLACALLFALLYGWRQAVNVEAWQEIAAGANRARKIAEAAEAAAYGRAQIASDALSDARLQIDEWRRRWAKAAESNAQLTKQLLGRVN